MCKNYVINNVNLDEVDKILNKYISTQNKNFDIYFIYCDFLIEFDNNFTTNKETNYVYNTDITDLYKFLLHNIDFFTARGYNVSNINQMTIRTVYDRCNMTYKHYMDQPMCMCENQINLNIAKNPQLINSLDRNKNHPLIRKYFLIPFKN